MMEATSVDAIPYQIVQIKDEIDDVAARLPWIAAPVFGALSLKWPRLHPAELGFIRWVSWLYALYHEAGRIGVPVLVERMTKDGLDPNRNLRQHPRLVSDMRTYTQHHLSMEKPHDQNIRNDCETWLREQCGSSVPAAEGQWRRCLSTLLVDTVAFLNALRESVRSIEIDESCDSICQVWAFRIQRYHAPHEFDRLIEVVTSDLGRPHTDVQRLRSRFHDKWVEELKSLRPDYVFEVEAMCLIPYFGPDRSAELAHPRRSNRVP